MRLLPLVIIICGIGLSACGPDYAFRESRDFPATNWTYADSIQYQFEIADTLQIYDLNLRLKHTTAYPFQNVYTKIHTRFPNGERLSELLSLELAGKGGNWLGECNAEECELFIPIQQGAYFNQLGTYQITIEQFTRRDPLPGLEKLTFELIRIGERAL
jgi:gliding motility-associated lipoprotein GldH